MRKNRLLLISLVVVNFLSAQELSKKSVDTTNFVYNYFTNEIDSIVYEIGSVLLMPSDSVSFLNTNFYKCVKDDRINGDYKIYYKDYLLFSYKLKDSKISGMGYCYYPFLGTVAIQGEFINGKLDGLVFVLEKDSRIVEVMKFRKGKYIKHIYHINFLQSKKINKSNPLKNEDVIRVW